MKYTDEEILAEERLSDEHEVLLYNLSLRQDDMNTQSTDMLLSSLEGDEAYQEMIQKDLLTYEIHDRGSVPVASLRVTMKGLRYCVLYADEIEPRRQFDVSGKMRGSYGSWGKDDRPQVDDETGRVVYPMMVSTGSSEGGIGLALSEAQRVEFAQINAKIAEANRHERELVYGTRSEERMLHTAEGDVLVYVVLDGTFVQIINANVTSRAFAIPEAIEELPVIAIGSGAFSGKVSAEEIRCSGSIELIGSGAFRCNPHLRLLTLPESVSEFQPGWIDQCPNLEELVLPGMLEKIKRGVLAHGRLKKLTLGVAAREIEPGVFQGSQLAEVSVHEGNPFITTDGAVLYSKDGAEGIALACPALRLRVREGVERIGRKFAHGFSQLKEVELPTTVTEIGPFAFSDTGLERFVAPPSLRVIGEKAFLNCTNLESVALNEGLEVIEDGAFQGSGITSLHIPASIRHIGASVTKETGVIHSGRYCSLSIDDQCESQFYDGQGGLYRRDEEGVHLVQLIDEELECYTVLDGCVGIDPLAFAYHDAVASVHLPHSVRRIGASAFRVCKSLHHVGIPDSLEAIGDEAFFDTNLVAFRIPPKLRELGARALVTYSAHFGKGVPSLRHIDVAPENDRFFMACGMLCRRTDEGASVVIYTGEDSRVVFPEDITRVEDYAFNNARGIECLSLNARLSTIGASGLAPRCWIRHIHVDVTVPLEGRTSFDFFFPHTPGGARAVTLGLGGANWVNVPGIAEQLDISLASAHDYNAGRRSDDISAYEQVRLMLGRLDDPVLLTPSNRDVMERVLRNNIVAICVDVALHDDRETFDALFDRGLVSADTLDGVIERVVSLRDAATSAHLLEAKHLRFAQDAFDYDL